LGVPIREDPHPEEITIKPQLFSEEVRAGFRSLR